MLIRKRTWTFRLVSVFLVAMVSEVGLAQESAEGEFKKADCGTNALFMLLNLEGRPVTLDRLEKSLPPRHRDGYSMAELAAVSASFGLELEGVRFGKKEIPLERPAIAFLNDARGGHFLVMRPVGSTGTRVQLIDPPHAPWVVDYQQILASNQWSGAILIARDSSQLIGIIAVACAIVALLAAVPSFRFCRRLRRLSILS